MDYGEKMFNWISEKINAGMTVYASTCLRKIKLTKKYADAIRYRGGHCEIRMGKRWDSINGCKVEAI